MAVCDKPKHKVIFLDEASLTMESNLLEIMVRTCTYLNFQMMCQTNARTVSKFEKKCLSDFLREINFGD